MGLDFACPLFWNLNNLCLHSRCTAEQGCLIRDCPILSEHLKLSVVIASSQVLLGMSTQQQTSGGKKFGPSEAKPLLG